MPPIPGKTYEMVVNRSRPSYSPVDADRELWRNINNGEELPYEYTAIQGSGGDGTTVVRSRTPFLSPNFDAADKATVEVGTFTAIVPAGGALARHFANVLGTPIHMADRRDVSLTNGIPPSRITYDRERTYSYFQGRDVVTGLSAAYYATSFAAWITRVTDRGVTDLGAQRFDFALNPTNVTANWLTGTPNEDTRLIPNVDPVGAPFHVTGPSLGTPAPLDEGAANTFAQIYGITLAGRRDSDGWEQPPLPTGQAVIVQSAEPYLLDILDFEERAAIVGAETNAEGVEIETVLLQGRRQISGIARQIKRAERLNLEIGVGSLVVLPQLDGDTWSVQELQQLNEAEQFLTLERGVD